MALIGRATPAFAERHIESSNPGALLGQDLFSVGQIKGVGRVDLDAVVDTDGGVAFGFLHAAKLPEAAAAVLHNDVLPFDGDRGLAVEAILTDNGKEYCGTEAHPDERYLAWNDIEHRTTRVRHPWTDGFVERVPCTALDGFFRVAFRTIFYESVEALQIDLDAWLVHDNAGRPAGRAPPSPPSRSR